MHSLVQKIHTLFQKNTISKNTVPSTLNSLTSSKSTIPCTFKKLTKSENSLTG